MTLPVDGRTSEDGWAEDVYDRDLLPDGQTEVTCGVCGSAVTAADFFEPPTWSLDPTGRPVLNKPIRMDPETGAVCWCPPRSDP